MSLTPGFAEPVAGAQACFRALLEAMSRPGRIQALAALPDAPAPLTPAAAAALLTLADADTPVWTDAGPAAEHWIRFHAGCPLVADPGAAAFLLATAAPPPLAALDPGTEEEPHRAATLILQVTALDEATGWTLSGPGIETTHRLRAGGMPAGFAAAWAANTVRFPRGVDLVLCVGDRLAALPRTTRIEEAV
ncbi:MAG: phosphonate lyase system protein PhnH [Belnapia sp.]|nr:phosphonate lyase system protein PhnH [Belnapia sp.]